MDNNVITDIRIPFVRLVVILVKLSLAAIPAAIIVFLIFSLLAALLATLFGGMPWMTMGG